MSLVRVSLCKSLSAELAEHGIHDVYRRRDSRGRGVDGTGIWPHLHFDKAPRGKQGQDHENRSRSKLKFNALAASPETIRNGEIFDVGASCQLHIIISLYRLSTSRNFPACRGIAKGKRAGATLNSVCTL